MGKKKKPSKRAAKLTLADLTAPQPAAQPFPQDGGYGYDDRGDGYGGVGMSASAGEFRPSSNGAYVPPNLRGQMRMDDPYAQKKFNPFEGKAEPEPAKEQVIPTSIDEADLIGQIDKTAKEVLSLSEEERRAMCAQSFEVLNTKPRKDGKAYISEAAGNTLAGVVIGLGAGALSDFGIYEALLDSAGKKSGGRGAALACMLSILERLGSIAMPYLISALPVVLACADSGAGVREKSQSVCDSLVKLSQPHDVAIMAPFINEIFIGDAKVRVKIAALEFLASLANNSTLASAVASSLPGLARPLIECCLETNAKISNVAHKTMRDVMCTVNHAETLTLKEEIFKALTDAGNETRPCIDTLMELTFVNPIEAPSLSLLVPIIVRGLGERDSVLVMNTCMTCCNVFGLVKDPRDMLPFKEVILSKIMEATQHSTPDVREKALQAHSIIQKALGDMDENRIAALETLRVKGAEKAKAVLSIAGGHLHAGLQKYLVHVFSTMATERWNVSTNQLTKLLLQAATSVVLPDTASEEDKSVLQELIAAVATALRPRGEIASVEEGEFLLELRGIILAFGGRVLLKSCDLLIKPGRCYGFVGQNGVGKTTLLTSIAKKTISNFPKDLPTYYVQHEILSELPISVVEFMKEQVPPGTSDAVVLGALKEVGFTKKTMQKKTSDLSGGWRMKLAIARSMMWKPELLMLDEPTNHLDTAAVEWLTQYVLNMRGTTTVCVVSHQYSFLADVLTDVVHMRNQNLEYHPYGFDEFQNANPEIVEALPSAENTIKDAVKDVKAAEAAHRAAQEKAKEKAKEASPEPEPEEAIERIQYDMNGKKRVERVVQYLPGRPDVVAIVFPHPGRLDGIRSKSKPVMTLQGAQFTYPGGDAPILKDASINITLGSRSALLGKNGAGKTTLLRMLVGETDPDEGVGKVWKHHNLRLAYIAQHSMHHLEECIDVAPAVYIQRRFARGMDREVAKLDSVKLTKEEQVTMTKYNEINAIVNRQERSGSLHYACTRKGKRVNKGLDAELFWIPVYNLERQAPYVMKLKRAYDEKIKAQASGMDIRATTRDAVRDHLAEFGIPHDVAESKIKRLSGGQRSRLVLAAAMWSKPHLIALDEPTNYLDNDTLAALTHALKKFRGAVITISHNQPFVEALCKEYYMVDNGQVTKTKKPNYDKV